MLRKGKKLRRVGLLIILSLSLTLMVGCNSDAPQTGGNIENVGEVDSAAKDYLEGKGIEGAKIISIDQVEDEYIVSWESDSDSGALVLDKDKKAVDFKSNNDFGIINSIEDIEEEEEPKDIEEDEIEYIEEELEEEIEPYFDSEDLEEVDEDIEG